MAKPVKEQLKGLFLFSGTRYASLNERQMGIYREINFVI
jgi:hypothetical protein